MTATRSRPRANQHQARQSGVVVVLSRERGDELFTCPLPDWNFIHELGRTFGWHPAGTTYLPQHGQQARDNPIKHDYQPGDSQDRKRVEADDSALWVTALDGARRSPFISGMLRNRVKLQGANATGTEQSLDLLLRNFIEFARRGAFTIALSDGSEHG